MGNSKHQAPNIKQTTKLKRQQTKQQTELAPGRSFGRALSAVPGHTRLPFGVLYLVVCL
jgi:aspartyl/asparaginyl beta-hydroxylase (cupin superfamily)